MNTLQQQAIDQALHRSLEDLGLSKDEEAALRDAIHAHAGDREALAFIRNRAFKLARQVIDESPAHVLRWLERIDKIVDNTASPPEKTANTASTALAFSPGEEGLNLIRRELNAARTTLDICVFTITDDRVTDAILAARDRGVAVRIVTDNDKQFDSGSDIARLVRAQVPTRFDPDRDHMHHKFAVADRKRLITGSYNWTRGATHNHENVMMLTDPALVDAFAKQFDKLWADFRVWDR